MNLLGQKERTWEGCRRSRWASESTRKWAEEKYRVSLEERILKDGFIWWDRNRKKEWQKYIYFRCWIQKKKDIPRNREPL
jgi:hypothetical protein